MAGAVGTSTGKATGTAVAAKPKAAKGASPKKAKAAAPTGAVDQFDVHDVRSAGIEPVATVPSKVLESVSDQFPVKDLSELRGHGQAGDVFFLDGGSLRDMKVNVRRVVDDGQAGFELIFRLMPADRKRLGQTLDKKGGEPGPWSFPAAEEQAGVTVYTGSKGTVDYDSSYGDGEADGDEGAWRTRATAQKGGTIELARGGSAVSIRGMVRINLRGDDATCTEQLGGILKEFGLQHAFAPPSAQSTERYRLIRLLWQADHSKAEQLSHTGKLDQMKIPQLKQALKAAGVGPKELGEARFAHITPTHFTVLNPAQVDAMVEAGARYLYSTCEKPEHVAAILEKGQKSSLRRYQDGLIFDGMSTQSDFNSGGGAGVFSRLVTQNAIMKGESWNGRRYRMVLRADVLARSDWFGHPLDEYGRAYDLDKSNFGTRLVEAIDDGGSYQDDNEIIFRDSIGPQYIAHVTTGSEKDKEDLIKVLEEIGFEPHDGKSLEEFVVVASNFIQFGPQPEIKDVPKYIAKALEDAKDYNEGKLEWFLAHGPAGKPKADLEAKLLSGKDSDLRDIFFRAIDQSGELAMSGAQLEKIAVKLAETKESSDYDAPDGKTLERFLRKCAPAILKLDHDPLTARIDGLDGKIGGKPDAWLGTLETLDAKLAPGETSKSFELALAHSEEALFQAKSKRFYQLLERHPQVSGGGPTWSKNRVDKIGQKPQRRELEHLIAQSQSTEDLGKLPMQLVENGSQHARGLLEMIHSKFGDWGLSPAELAKALPKLGPASKTRAYFLTPSIQPRLIRTGHMGVLKFLEKAWNGKAKRPKSSELLALVGTLAESGQDEAALFALRNSAADLIPSDAPGPSSVFERLREAEDLYAVKEEGAFIKSALEKLGAKTTRDDATLRLAWLFARSDESTRADIVELALKAGTKDKADLLEWFQRFTPGRQLALPTDRLVALALELSAKGPQPSSSWVMKNAGRLLVESLHPDIGPLIEGKEPHVLGIEAKGIRELLRQTLSKKGSAGTPSEKWLLDQTQKRWRSVEREEWLGKHDGWLSAFKDLEVYPEDLGLTSAKDLVQAIHQQADDVLDELESGTYENSNTYEDHDIPDGLPARFDWLIRRGSKAIDDEVVDELLKQMPDWNEGYYSNWHGFLDRLEDALPKKWSSKIEKTRKKMDEDDN